ncbi:MAG: hypothetical protein ACT4QG_12540 [Sporichthyaceae bacterium]
MNGSAKVAVFALALASLAASGYAVGRSTDSEETVSSARQAASSAPALPGSAPVDPAPIDPAAAVAGLAVVGGGYSLRLLDPTVEVGADVPVRLEIVGPDGTPVRVYRATHEKDLHLIVVRRDLTRFAHLHPQLGGDGVWEAVVPLDSAGVYRVFADFAPAALGQTLTLGADLFVAGDFQPLDLPEPAATWSDPEYSVVLSGSPQAGAESELTFAVSRAGAPVADLEPYLGAFGHLVSLRPADLAYLHTHPAGHAAADARGPQVRFATTFPTAGRYRLYLNFSHAGTVRTAEFTVEVPAAAQQPADVPAPSSPAGEHAGH